MPEPLDVTKLEAGRDTDALIARALGWTQVAEWGMGAIARGYAITEMAGRPPGGDRTEPVPYFSTDIAAAWQVIRQFSSYRLFWNAYLKTHECDLTRYRPARFGHGEGSTPELAICRAARDALA